MNDDEKLMMRRLHDGQEVMFEGVTIKGVPVDHSEEHCGDKWPCTNTNIEPGDTYMAGRNTSPQLLTCAFVKKTLGKNDEFAGAVFPVENAYPFDIPECIKIEIKV